MRTAAFLIVAATFTANTPLWAGESGEHGSMSVYAAGPCAAPGYGAESLQSGCCQCQRSCCDDAWAGYCQKKHQGFCLPCIRPARGQCATVPSARCAECQSGMPTPPSTDHELEPPSAPAPSVKPKLPPLPTTKLPPPRRPNCRLRPLLCRRRPLCLIRARLPTRRAWCSRCSIRRPGKSVFLRSDPPRISGREFARSERLGFSTMSPCADTSNTGLACREGGTLRSRFRIKDHGDDDGPSTRGLLFCAL